MPIPPRARLGLVVLVSLPASAGAQDLGAATLLAGPTFPTSPTGRARLGVVGAMTFVLGSLAVGPEAGWYRTGGPEFSPSSRAENVVTLGGVVRLDLTRGAWVPYAVGGAHVEFWESTRGGYPTENAWGLSGGVGLRQTTAGPFGLVAEARFHGDLPGSADRRRTWVTLTAGVDWRW